MNDVTVVMLESLSTLSLPQRREVPDKAAKAGARALKAKRKAAKAARRRNRRRNRR